MGQTAIGARKTRAKKLGITLEEYLEKEQSGLKWCCDCKCWQSRELFGVDNTRSDGLSTHCITSRHTGNPRGWHGRPNNNPVTGRPGPTPKKSRDGDKIQARAKVNQAVKFGRLPDPDDLACMDCGHIKSIETPMRHSYDHYLGYSGKNHLDVEAVCNSCHGKRSVRRGELKPPSSLGLKRPGQNDNRLRRADGTFVKGGRQGGS